MPEYSGAVVLVPWRQGQAAAGLDRLQPERTVVAGAGQDDADGVFVQALRHRVEKRVDRGGFPGRIGWYPTQRQAAVVQGRDGAGRDHQDVVRSDRVAVPGLGHRHVGPARQDFRQHALAAGCQVQDDDEAQSAVRRHFLEEAMKCLDPSGRSSDPDDGQGATSRRIGRDHTGAGVQKDPRTVKAAGMGCSPPGRSPLGPPG
jgi:hypothetical protein